MYMCLCIDAMYFACAHMQKYNYACRYDIISLATGLNASPLSYTLAPLWPIPLMNWVCLHNFKLVASKASLLRESTVPFSLSIYIY